VVPSLSRRGHFFERPCRPQIAFEAGGIDVINANDTSYRHLTTDTPSYTDAQCAGGQPPSHSASAHRRGRTATCTIRPLSWAAPGCFTDLLRQRRQAMPIDQFCTPPRVMPPSASRRNVYKDSQLGGYVGGLPR
jgi:hypothetical protein